MRESSPYLLALMYATAAIPCAPAVYFFTMGIECVWDACRHVNHTFSTLKQNEENPFERGAHHVP